MYWLKKEDLPLILFDIEKGSYGDQSIHIRWMSEKTEDLPERISDESSLEAWIQHRMIPRNRAFVEEILASQGLKYKDMEGLITICKGLSVNDVYWIVPEDFQGRFDDYNLYDNSFSEALSLVAFTGYLTTLKELSPSPEMTTNGMLPKAWRRLNDKLYLYDKLRNQMTHTFIPGGDLLLLNHADPAGRYQHLQYSGGKLVLIADVFYQDICQACRRLVNHLKEGRIKPKNIAFENEG